MASPRVRKYVNDNSACVETWMNTLLELEIQRLLNNKYLEDEPKTEIKISKIEFHAGKARIVLDVLEEHYGLAYGRINGIDSYLKVQPLAFEEAIKALDEKPEFNLNDPDKISEDSIYTRLSEISLGGLAYIYHHQDEFTFKKCPPSRTGYASFILGVIYKDIEKEADRISFRNAIDSMYSKKIPEVGTVAFNKDWSHMAIPAWDIKRDHSYEITKYLEALVPKSVPELNTGRITECIQNVKEGIQTLQGILENLTSALATIEESGGDAAFRERFYEKAIDDFRDKAPLLINSEDDDIRELVVRISKKSYK